MVHVLRFLHFARQTHNETNLFKTDEALVEAREEYSNPANFRPYPGRYTKAVQPSTDYLLFVTAAASRSLGIAAVGGNSTALNMNPRQIYVFTLFLNIPSLLQP